MASQKSRSTDKIAFIDNLRTLLIILVVLHHSFITYGAPGSWYFTEKTNNTLAIGFMSLVTTANMTFFMGLIFFLSSCFIEKSLTGKGTKKFLLDRFKRLGIPLAFYSMILSPTLNYISEHYGRREHDSFIGYLRGYRHWIDFGVLWFVAALLLFTLFFVLFRRIKAIPVMKYSLPANKAILGIAIILGIITWLVRGIFPIGWTLFPLNFQLAYFPQYIALFSLGIIACRNSWLEKISLATSRLWLRLALILIVIVLPLMVFFIKKENLSLDSFNGHFTWPSLLFAQWEMITGISIIVALLGIAYHRLNRQTKLTSTLARTSYGVFIFHPLVLVCLSLLAQGIPIEPLIKLFFVFPLAVIFSFLLSYSLTRIPFVAKII
ncbi:MAG: hypothetical protein C5B59_10685 [Bacteroidetes bacterium]|nr:MAG: hypothetical protein C5B59_10685 [Bacteroidota bacterium]